MITRAYILWHSQQFITRRGPKPWLLDKTISHKLNPYTTQINIISVSLSRHPSTKALKVLRVPHSNRIFNFSVHKVDDIYDRFRSKNRLVTESKVPSYGTQPKIKQNSHLIYASKTKQHRFKLKATRNKSKFYLRLPNVALISLSRTWKSQYSVTGRDLRGI